MKNTKTLVLLSLFITLQIILTRFLSIQTPILRIGFGFIPLIFSSILFGPVLGGICAAISDILGMFIFPQGTYFPGFTLSAFLSGLIYGSILHKKSISLLRISFSSLLVKFIIDIGLNTFWLSIITGKAVAILLIPRVTKTLIMIPVEIFLVYILWIYLGSSIKSQVN
ncbi:folate family ECF transporter S component [Clostridium sp. YIM B02505]|uniref:Folate family ECF transporter S component n=1 Tax=Clostridium yunnanense TaxID=2800325 RepID=A0ABS1EJ52_9CLOT|nr:folate family ECF transporter S component [Clostridium yunnanense]MBK1809391.1 folate family ECF transporter S component [Clostridium yunnanense]